MHPTPQPETGTLVMAPVSPAVAALLHQLQAQIIKEAGDRPGPQLALPADGTLRYTRTEHRERGGHRVIDASDPAGNQLHLQTPTAANPEHNWMRPGRWYGSETRVDSAGREWRRTVEDEFVMDDFGQLVAIPRELQ